MFEGSVGGEIQYKMQKSNKIAGDDGFPLKIAPMIKIWMQNNKIEVDVILLINSLYSVNKLNDRE